jgi:hypothetical protein
MNAKMDEVLKKNGINRAAQFRGTIEGNGAHILMGKCVAIIDEMEEHVVLGVSARVAGTDDEIRHVGMMHKHLLTYLNGYFSALWTKQFHVMPKILERAKLYRNQVLALERYLGMSMTMKIHLAEDHSVQMGILARILESAITKMRQKLIDILDASKILQLGSQSRAKRKCR